MNVSNAYYKLGGLRFWNEDEIQLREMFQSRIASVVKYSLSEINSAWQFIRIEGPCLAPRSAISPAYSDDDVFVTNHIAGGSELCLRAETTHSSYTAAHQSGKKLPLCVWQVGKSFRRESNDGASAAKLRFNEFYQQEFQCIYRADTKADYRKAVMETVIPEVSRFTGLEVRIVASDRLPAYSESTLDIECMHNGKWREVASCSIRNDYYVDTKVFELAFGLCRIATMAAEKA